MLISHFIDLKSLLDVQCIIRGNGFRAGGSDEVNSCYRR